MTTIVKFLRPLGLAAATVAAGSFILQSAPASAAQLVTNETFSAPLNTNGTVPGWATTGTNTGIVDTTPLNSGLTFGNVGAVGSLLNLTGPFTGSWSQSLSTRSGSTYALDYTFANYASLLGLTPAGTFQVKVGNTILDTLTNAGLTSGTRLNRTFVGSGTDILSFTFTGVAASAIDNVVVNGDAPLPSTAAPEPFTIIGTLIGGTAAVRMRKKLNLSK
jgi:hypothetical protein